MIKFEHPEYLHLLWLLLAVGLLFVFFIFWRNKTTNKFAQKENFKILAPGISNVKHYFKFVLLVLAFVALTIGLANPQIGTKLETVKREGVDVIIALDVSKSMDAKDTQPSRMLKAKQFVSNLVNKMSNDRIGLIVFAGNAYLQMPLTVDYSAAKMYLKQIDTDLIPTQGTAIGDAVDIAKISYPENSKNQKVLIIISDGENHEGDAEDAIKEAKDNGIKVITVGVGTTAGAPIPVGTNGQFKKDNEGNVITTKLSEDMLKNLASKANGKYYNISNEKTIEKIVTSLGSLDGKVFEEKVVTDYKDQFQIFIGIAFVLLLLDMFIGYKKSKFQLNLFKN